MQNYRNPFYWSFPCGTWFEIRVRMSILMPLLWVLVCLRLEDLQLGLLFSAVLLASVVFHEFGHVIAARMTGGFGDEILLWPLGGLAFTHPGHSFLSRLLTPAAGPLVNLVLCLIVYPFLILQGRTEGIFSLFVFPLAGLSEHILADVLVLTFWVNLWGVVINLIPVYPLDGGRMLKAVLNERLQRELADDIYIKAGMICGFVCLLLGLFFDQTLVVFFGTFLLLMNMQEWFQLQTADVYSESFMGYDFSQGYTSLEKGETAAPREKRPGFFARWRQQRQAEKLRKRQQREAEAEKQLDYLLQKVHSDGIESLSEAEQRLLRQVSEKYREKDRGPT